MEKKIFINAVIDIVFIIINTIITYNIYKLNKRDINPKVSFSPKLEDFSLLDKYSYDSIDKLEEKEIELFNRYNNDWYNHDILFYDDVYKSDIDFTLSGFPQEEDNKKLWILNIENKGEFPAFNLEIELELVIKRVKVKTGIDESDIINVSFEEYKSIKKQILLDYLPAFYSKKIKLLNISGDFIEADLYINSAKSQELKYIKKPIKIDTYTHDSYSMGAQDSPHYKRIIGYYKKV